MIETAQINKMNSAIMQTYILVLDEMYGERTGIEFHTYRDKYRN